MDLLFNAAQRFILIKDYSNILDFKEIESEFEKLTWRKNVGNNISEEMTFFDNEIFNQTKHILVEECEKYLNNTLQLQNFYTKLNMTNSWGNITNPGENHHEHKHPFSILSGTLYLDNNPSNLNLYVESYLPEVPYFITRNISYVGMGDLLRDANIGEDKHNNLKHHLVLFLSNSNHFVHPDQNATVPRRSVSFNTFWDGMTGIKDQALGSFTF